jgi:hypothetical protein
MKSARGSNKQNSSKKRKQPTKDCANDCVPSVSKKAKRTPWRQWIQNDVLRIFLAENEQIDKPLSISLPEDGFEQIDKPLSISLPEDGFEQEVATSRMNNPGSERGIVPIYGGTWRKSATGFRVSFIKKQADALHKENIEAFAYFTIEEYGSLERAESVGKTMVRAICRYFKWLRVGPIVPVLRRWTDALDELLLPGEDILVPMSVCLELNAQTRKAIEDAGSQIKAVVVSRGSYSETPGPSGTTYNITFSGKTQIQRLNNAGFSASFSKIGEDAQVVVQSMHRVMCRKMGWIEAAFDFSLTASHNAPENRLTNVPSSEENEDSEQREIDPTELKLYLPVKHDDTVVPDEFINGQACPEDCSLLKAHVPQNEADFENVASVQTIVSKRGVIKYGLTSENVRVHEYLHRKGLKKYQTWSTREELNDFRTSMCKDLYMTRLKPLYNDSKEVPINVAGKTSGFIDGDGMLCIDEGGHVRIVFAQSGRCTPLILRYYHLLFGGNLQCRLPKEGSDIKNVRPSWVLCLSRPAEWMVVAEVMRDHGILKAFQAEIALQLAAGKISIDEARKQIGMTQDGKGTNKTALYRAMKINKDRLTDAYVSGLFDAEGCVQIAKGKYYPYVNISQTSSPALLGALAEKLGGITEPKNKEARTWHSPSASKLVVIVDMLLKHTLQKRDQLLELRRFLNFPRHRGRSLTEEWKQYVDQMRVTLSAMKKK